MNLALTSLLDLLPATTAMRLGWVCIHSVWQAAAVAALLAVALRLIPRRSTAALNARYLLAVAALFALPVLAVATFLAVPGERTSDRGLTGPAAAAVAGMPVAKEVLVMPHGAGAANSAAAASSSRAAVAVLAQDLASRVEPWLPLAAAAWVAGMLVAAVRMMAGWALTRRLVARATAVADGRWQARVNRWRRALDIDGMVRLLASDAIGAPVVVGWLKPVILWPAGALVGMGPQEIDAIIAHELAHVRRRDMLVNLLQACIDVLFFHHPAAWWISAQVRGEREHCADDLAVRALESGGQGTRLSYAKALVSLEERRIATAFAMAADGGSLVDRIRRLAGVEAPQASPARLVAGVLATACMVAVVVAGAVAPRPALAAEEKALPKDTNTITSLTPEEAKKLAAESGPRLFLRGLTTLSPEVASELAKFGGVALTIKCGDTIDVETAQALAQFKGNMIRLDGPTTISPEAAEALAAFKGIDLNLSGLTTLSDKAAKALAQFNGTLLFLNGLTTISPEVATALAEFKGSLYLNGLKTLSPEAKKALEKSNRRVSLSGLNKTDATKDKPGSVPSTDEGAGKRTLSEDEMEHLRKVVADSDFVACMTLGPAGFTGNSHRHEAKVTAICKGSPRTTVVFAAINPDPPALPAPIDPPPANPLPTIGPGDYVVILNRREIVSSFPLADTLGKSYNYSIKHDNRSHFAWEKNSPEAEYVRRLCMGK